MLTTTDLRFKAPHPKISGDLTLKYQGLALVVNALREQTGERNIYLAAGPEDLRVLLHLIDLGKPGSHAAIMVRPYIHTMGLYLKNIDGTLCGLFFDPQAWGNRYYPNRLIIDVLHQNGVVLSTYDRAVQGPNESGCYAHSVNFIEYCLSEGVDPFAGDSNGSLQVCAYTLLTLPLPRAIQVGNIERKRRNLHELFEQELERHTTTSQSISTIDEDSIQATIDAVTGTALLPAAELSCFELYDISLAATDTEVPCTIKYRYDGIKPTDYQYADLLTFADVEVNYPAEIRKDASKRRTLTFPGCEVEMTEKGITISASNLKTLLSGLNQSLDETHLTALLHQRMNQQLALRELIKEVKLKIQCEMVESDKVQQGGLSLGQVAYALKQALGQYSNDVYITFANNYNAQDKMLLQELRALHKINGNMLPHVILIPYAINREHQILLAIDSFKKQLVIYESQANGGEGPSDCSRQFSVYIQGLKQITGDDFELVVGESPYQTQTNDFSCGIFVFAHGKDFVSQIFDQSLSRAQRDPGDGEKAVLDVGRLLPEVLFLSSVGEDIQHEIDQAYEVNRQIKIKLRDLLEEIDDFLELYKALQAECDKDQDELIKQRSLYDFTQSYCNNDSTKEARLLYILLLFDPKQLVQLEPEKLINLVNIAKNESSYNALLLCPISAQQSYIDSYDESKVDADQGGNSNLDISQLAAFIEIELDTFFEDNPENLDCFESVDSLLQGVSTEQPNDPNAKATLCNIAMLFDKQKFDFSNFAWGRRPTSREADCFRGKARTLIAKYIYKKRADRYNKSCTLRTADTKANLDTVKQFEKIKALKAELVKQREALAKIASERKAIIIATVSGEQFKEYLDVHWDIFIDFIKAFLPKNVIAFLDNQAAVVAEEVDKTTLTFPYCYDEIKIIVSWLTQVAKEPNVEIGALSFFTPESISEQLQPESCQLLQSAGSEQASILAIYNILMFNIGHDVKFLIEAYKKSPELVRLYISACIRYFNPNYITFKLESYIQGLLDQAHRYVASDEYEAAYSLLNVNGFAGLLRQVNNITGLYTSNQSRYEDKLKILQALNDCENEALQKTLEDVYLRWWDFSDEQRLEPIMDVAIKSKNIALGKHFLQRYTDDPNKYVSRLLVNRFDDHRQKDIPVLLMFLDGGIRSKLMPLVNAYIKAIQANKHEAIMLLFICLTEIDDVNFDLKKNKVREIVNFFTDRLHAILSDGCHESEQVGWEQYYSNTVELVHQFLGNIQLQLEEINEEKFLNFLVKYVSALYSIMIPSDETKPIDNLFAQCCQEINQFEDQYEDFCQAATKINERVQQYQQAYAFMQLLAFASMSDQLDEEVGETIYTSMFKSIELGRTSSFLNLLDQDLQNWLSKQAQHRHLVASCLKLLHDNNFEQASIADNRNGLFANQNTADIEPHAAAGAPGPSS